MYTNTHTQMISFLHSRVSPSHKRPIHSIFDAFVEILVSI